MFYLSKIIITIYSYESIKKNKFYFNFGKRINLSLLFNNKNKAISVLFFYCLVAIFFSCLYVIHFKDLTTK